MSLLNDIKKKGNIIAKHDLALIESRIYELKWLIQARLDTFGLPKSKSDLTCQYAKELKDIQKFLKKCKKECLKYE